MVIVAAENWTDTAQGTAIAFITTPLGSNEDAAHMVIMPDGNVGIGTFDDAPDDHRQAAGLRRHPGWNGRHQRLHQELRRHWHRWQLLFRPALQEGHHAVPPRARSAHGAAAGPLLLARSDFPEQHFGDGRAYGLIAQDVEQVLPELVVTNDDGFKAVDYSKLPLLTIQAVKDLKSENDGLKQRIAELEKSHPQALKQRVAELERLVTELLAASSRR